MAEEHKKEGLMEKIKDTLHHDKYHDKDKKPQEGQSAAPAKKEGELEKIEDFAKKEGHEFAAYDRREGVKLANDEIWGPGGPQPGQ